MSRVQMFGVTAEDLDAALADYATSADLQSAIADFVTAADVTTLIDAIWPAIYAQTSNPGVAGQPWNDSGTLKFSYGPLPMLDSITTAAAFGMRKLRTAYSGYAIRVRRSSDNTEQDIGFTTTDLSLDTAALLAFVGSGSGYVTTWYDQSGNSRNATQATAANQPRIVNAGTLDTLGGKPTLYLDGSRWLDVGGSSHGNTATFSSLCVLRRNQASAASLNPWGNRGAAPDGGRAFLNTLTTNQLVNVGSGVVSQTTVNATNYINVTISSGGTSRLRINAGESSGSLSYTTSNGGYTIGRQGVTFTSQRFIGHIAELVLSDSAFDSTQINTIESSCEWYYGITLLTTPTITLTSPVDYQIYQRNGSNQANITITGTYTGTPTTIEARWNGGTWTTIVASPSGYSFSGTLSSQATGQGTLEVRFSNNTAITDSAAYVGVGEVFGVWGQSNNSGRGISNQTYSHATLKAGLYGNDNQWKQLADPFDSNASQVDSVSSDSAAAGSWVPACATALMAALNCPVAFVPCAMGGTSITQWQPGASHVDRATLYGSANYRCQQAGGIRMVLWWQGETDAIAAMSQATYESNLSALATAIATDLGVNTMPCILQNSSGITDGNEALIRAATSAQITAHANIIPGPDFSATGSDDSYHFTSNSKLTTAGEAWATAIDAIL